jgi:hypothetical protein
VTVIEALYAAVTVEVTVAAVTVTVREALYAARDAVSCLTSGGRVVTAKVSLTCELVVLTDDTGRPSGGVGVTDREAREAARVLSARDAVDTLDAEAISVTSVIDTTSRADALVKVVTALICATAIGCAVIVIITVAVIEALHAGVVAEVAVISPTVAVGEAAHTGRVSA